MTHAIDYCYHDFRHEITELLKENGIGHSDDPVKIVRHAVLKTACGFENGITTSWIIANLGYADSKGNLTAKGKAFLWKEFGEGC